MPPLTRNQLVAEIDPNAFNSNANLPYSLRLQDFDMAMRDIYDLFADINYALLSRGLGRFDDMLRPAGMTGTFSDALTASLASHSRSLTENTYHNGHPDLIPAGTFPNNAVQSGPEGVEIKSTRRSSPAVDTHGARDQWVCVFRYHYDDTTQPHTARSPTRFVEVLLAYLYVSTDFRVNERGPLGTRTASPNRSGLAKLRSNWIYREPTAP